MKHLSVEILRAFIVRNSYVHKRFSIFIYVKTSMVVYIILVVYNSKEKGNKI